MKVYGYCRISTKAQSIERQERNIKAAFPTAIIVKEAYTGTKLAGRKGLDSILSRVAAGDTIVFDSVSRMSRNATEGVALYEDLFSKGVNLVFLKEPYCNSDTYREALAEKVPMTGADVDIILAAVNKYLLRLAKRQIEIAFDQAQKEVDDLHQRTVEGMETARLAGKQIGGVEGKKLTTKKSVAAKAVIRQHSKAFGGSLDDPECMKLAGVSRNSFYKYKREILEELEA